MKNELKILIVIISILPITYNFGQDWKQVIDLSGYWKFNIGDDNKWADYNFNDKNWEEVRVPSSWEDEGYHGYNGYAWYRKTFSLPKNLENNSLYVTLGYIDDVDEVYFKRKINWFYWNFSSQF